MRIPDAEQVPAPASEDAMDPPIRPVLVGKEHQTKLADDRVKAGVIDHPEMDRDAPFQPALVLRHFRRRRYYAPSAFSRRRDP